MTARLVVTIEIASDWRNLSVQDVEAAAQRLADELGKDYTVLNNQPVTAFRLPDAAMTVAVQNPDKTAVWPGDID